MGSTLPAFGFVTSSAYMPRLKRSTGRPMRSRKARSEVTTCFLVTDWECTCSR